MFNPLPIPRRSPWASQILVIKALLRRELATKFGPYKLGFFWMLLEPLITTLVLGLVLSPIIGRTVPEIPFAFFLLNGKLLLKLFTGPMSSGINALKANAGLIVYPKVKILDVFIARFLYDLITVTFSFVVFSAVAVWIGVELYLGSLHILAVCFLLTWLMGCGLGLIFGVGAVHIRELEKVVPILQAPLMFISAVMFPSNALPESVQKYLLWNPLVHTIELSRKSLFPFYQIPNENLWYPFVVMLVLLGLGLIFLNANLNFLSKR